MKSAYDETVDYIDENYSAEESLDMFTNAHAIIRWVESKGEKGKLAISLAMSMLNEESERKNNPPTVH